MFSSDDTKVVTIGTDKQLIVWEITNDDDGSNEYKAKDIYKIDTKRFTDLALCGNRLVVMGVKELQVFNLNAD